MKCKAVTQDRTADPFRNGVPHPCPYAAMRNGYCGIHNPDVLLPRMESRRAKLAAELEYLDESIRSYRKTFDLDTLENPS